MSKVFVLRTHALLSGRNSTLRFGDDNEIVIPISVLDEMEANKNETFEKARIQREFEEYLNSFPIEQLTTTGCKQQNGSILRLSKNYTDVKVQIEGISETERRTLQTCLGIMKEEHKEVILVTNNANLQIKAKILGIKGEPFKDESFPKLSEQYTGREEVFTRNDIIDSFYEKGYMEKEDVFDYKKIEFIENKFFEIHSEEKSALGVCKGGKIVKLRTQSSNPYGIKAKNAGQRFMLEALMNSDCPLVVIKGTAGTGKTFCALAVGLEGTETKQEYSRILVTRSVTASEEYGYLPGDIDEKLAPYLAGIKDNLAILINGTRHSNKKNADQHYEDGSYYFERGIVQIQAIGFLRGRSIVDTYFIIDETQNIEPATIKSIVTRAAEGSKFIFLGDPTQIDNPNLTERYNGLTYLSEKMKGNPICTQITLLESESVRSKLAKEAARIL